MSIRETFRKEESKGKWRTSCRSYLQVLKVRNVTGEYDDLPEQAFYMVGSIDEVVEKAKTLK